MLPDDLTTVNENSAFRPDSRWEELQLYVKLTRSLRGSTETMREEVPPDPYPKESGSRLRQRIRESYLLDVYDRGITTPSDKGFSQGLHVQADEPEWFKEKMRGSVDRFGTKLNAWAPVGYEMGIDRGIKWTLTDATRGAARNTAYWSHVTTSTLLGLQTEPDRNGVLQPSQVRILEEHRGASSSVYQQSSVMRVRVIDLPSKLWSVWEMSEDGEDVEIESGEWPLDEITLRSFRGDNKTAEIAGFAKPKRLALLWKNIEHWNVASQVGNYRASTLMPIREMIGLTDDEFKKINHLGQGLVIHSSQEAGDVRIGIIETTGVPLVQGREELMRMEAQMEFMAKAPLMARPNVTATQDVINDGEATSSVQQEFMCYEDHLNECSGDINKFEARSQKVSEAPIEIPGKKYAVTRDPGDYKNVLETFREVEKLPEPFQAPALEEAKTYGVLSDKTDVEDLLRQLREAGPQPGETGMSRSQLRAGLDAVKRGEMTEEQLIDDMTRPSLGARPEVDPREIEE